MRSQYKNIARVVKPHGRKGEVLAQPLRGLPSVLTPGMRVALTPPALKRFGLLGTIVEIMSTPANDVWVVEGDRYGEVLIPVIEQVVLDLPDQGTISVHVMDGLIDMDK